MKFKFQPTDRVYIVEKTPLNNGALVWVPRGPFRCGGMINNNLDKFLSEQLGFDTTSDVFIYVPNGRGKETEALSVEASNVFDALTDAQRACDTRNKKVKLSEEERKAMLAQFGIIQTNR